MIRFTFREGLHVGPMRVPTWRVLLMAATAVIVVIAVAVFSIALLLLLLPVVLGVLLLRRLRFGPTTGRRPASTGVIEADYVVLSDPRLGRDA